MSYQRTGVWFGPETDATFFSVLVWAFLVVVMAVINCQGIGVCVIEHADALQ